MSDATSPPTSEPARVPSASTSFVGREREVALAHQVLASARLVTLTGAGGSGKTRIAAEVARARAAESADDVAWIELAAVADATLVASHVATTLGIGGAGRPPADALSDALRTRALLLVIDNCEHVVGAVAALVDRLLRECPGLRVLATSREALGIPGERAWLVPALSLPPADATVEGVMASEAGRLFIERAKSASASFAITDANAPAVARICRRLDGLPLAIELAAARIRALTPEQIATRLDEGFRVLETGRRGVVPRHRTLRAAIGWSYDLLDPAERLVFQRLSVFAGDFSLDAAEAVCASDDVARDEVLDHLATLVDKSLVLMRDRTDEARYRLLETIRQFAFEHLEASGHAGDVQARHADFLAGLIREAEPHLITPSRPAWVDRLRRELDDIRAVLGWSRERDPALYLDLAGRLGWFWYSTGLWTEGRRWLDDALSLPTARAATADRARALFAAGVVASLQGQGGPAHAWLEEAASIARMLGDGRLRAYAASYQGVALGQEGLAAAEAPTREALAWFEAAGDLYGQRLAMVVLVTLLIRHGDLDAARDVGARAVTVARAYGLGRELGIALQIFGTVLLHRRELDAAALRMSEALRALRDDPQPFWLARAMELEGVIECARGNPALGVRLFGAAEARRDRMGAVLFRLDRERLAPHLAAARSALGDAAFDEAWAAGRAMPLEDAVDAAIAAGTGVHAAAQPPAITARSIGPGGATHRAARDNGDVGASGTSDEPGPCAMSDDLAPPSTLDDRCLLRIRMFGTLEIELGGAPLPESAWKYAKPRELFAYLVMRPEGRTREEIGAAFWPDATPAQVKNNFHVVLHHMRRALGRPDLVVFEHGRYRVNRAVGVAVDVERFEAAMAEARRMLRSNPTAPESLARLRAALAIHRGDFLGSESMGDWHLEDRDRLRRLWLDGLVTLGDCLDRAGAHDDAVAVHREIVRADEWNEEAHRRLMVALARAGYRNEALRHYDRFVTALERELGSVPDGRTTALRDRLSRVGLQ